MSIRLTCWAVLLDLLQSLRLRILYNLIYIWVILSLLLVIDRLNCKTNIWISSCKVLTWRHPISWVILIHLSLSSELLLSLIWICKIELISRRRLLMVVLVKCRATLQRSLWIWSLSLRAISLILKNFIYSLNKICCLWYILTLISSKNFTGGTSHSSHSTRGLLL